MRGTFDARTRSYVLSDEDRRKQRRAEAATKAWRDAHPYVDAEYGCDLCMNGVIWSAESFYEHYGRVPLSVDQAREHEAPCGWCIVDYELAPGDYPDGPPIGRLEFFTLYAPGATEDDEPLLEWGEET